MHTTTRLAAAVALAAALAACGPAPAAPAPAPTTTPGTSFDFEQYVELVTGKAPATPQPSTWVDLMLPPVR